MTTPEEPVVNPNAMGGTCLNCKFWDTQDGVRGRCRAHAPLVTTSQIGAKAMWPTCMSDDWCGEWVVKP